MESFVNEAIRQDPDIIFWLGDNPGHNTYEQTKEGQIEYFKYVSQLFKKGNYRGKIYAVMGNHDTYPAGQFDVFGQTHQWLTKGFADELAYWYTPEATEMFAKYGCFSMLHPGTRLKIIGLNNFVLDFTNLYLWGNSTNPFGLVLIKLSKAKTIAGLARRRVGEK
eukprot:TRINITY_DN2634_c0_g1_i1.p2 TRINITY_DN2634_c0_g1~~TRINITY_DN2634_c0_g1_i1.p2  ORF type:complete len:165 (-),score=16.08 TRINITY_DN2634_c0_g1_i1:831-1325(-)